LGGLDPGIDAFVHWRLVHPAVLRERDDVRGGDGTGRWSPVGPGPRIGRDAGSTIATSSGSPPPCGAASSSLCASTTSPSTPGLVISMPRSKTNQTGDSTELVVLPRASSSTGRPATALEDWLELAEITAGPVLSRVTKANRPGPTGVNPETINERTHAMGRAISDGSASAQTTTRRPDASAAPRSTRPVSAAPTRTKRAASPAR
jgi:hypothetical protein